ncbi:hypothetical protein LMG23994_06411 [Cupriavidus pinatubonensis]|uniref:Uncharacterized protein n=1 Tax=Cupriavidus pinatubonensis TaxID=248026 RepID=A0ABN7ZRD3_9BURK|nr:hypothetical protein LMG23994_06411 [Cupriavidus pinatubonensis]
MEVTKRLKPSVKRVTKYSDGASVQTVTRVNAEQASKTSMRRPTRLPYRGRPDTAGRLSRQTPSRCAGVVATACTQGKRTQHGKPPGVVRDDQPDTREGQAGRLGVTVTERPVAWRTASRHQGSVRHGGRAPAGEQRVSALRQERPDRLRTIQRSSVLRPPEFVNLCMTARWKARRRTKRLSRYARLANMCLPPREPALAGARIAIRDGQRGLIDPSSLTWQRTCHRLKVLL